MYNLSKITQLVEKQISEIKFPDKPQGLYEPIKYMLTIGGKRLRPSLLLIGYYLFKNDIEKAINQAIAYEVFHNFTLIHDDVMDNSKLRRNVPTVHTKWDINTAILSGDSMLIKAYQFIVKCENKYIPDILEIFSKVAAEVCEGQQYDMNFETKDDVSVKEYIEMIRLKTGVLIAGSLQTGAILADASNSDSKLLYEFGEKIGLAFQLQDDLLDVYGSTDVFGKKQGGDIIAKKKTFLMLSALSCENEDLRNRLNSLLASTTISDEELVLEVTKIYNQLDLKRISSELSNKYYEQALTALNSVSADSSKKQILFNIAELIMNRKS